MTPVDLARECVICARHRHETLDDGSTSPDCAPACKPRAAAESLLICRRCFERLDDRLADIPELYAIAGGELHPGQGDGGRSTEVSLGLRVSALDLRTGGDVLERLATWERDIRETFGDDPVRSGNGRQQALDRYARGARYGQDTVAMSLVGVVGYLRAKLHTVAQAHYAVDEFARDLADIHAQAVSAARMGTRPGWRVDCPADHLEGICGRSLRVSGQDFGGTVTCRKCGTEWDVSRLLRVVSSTKSADVWLPAEEVTLLLNVHGSTLRRWAARGDVERSGGRYSLESVRAAIAARLTDPTTREKSS